MNYSWMNDGDLSGKSDRDYLGELVQSLTQDLHADPNCVELLFKRGNAYLDSGLYEEAILDYTTILRREITDPRVWNNRGICNRIIGDVDEAISDAKPLPLTKAEVARRIHLKGKTGIAKSNLSGNGPWIASVQEFVQIGKVRS